MVRTTIACFPCRKLKVKCMHEGVPPCRNCLKKGRTRPGDCVLTGPELRKKRVDVPTARREGSHPASNTIVPDASAQRIASVTGDISRRRASLCSGTRLASGQSQVEVPPPHKLSLNFSHKIMSRTLGIFIRKFPELRFLHLPSFLKAIRGLEAGGQGRLSDEGERGQPPLRLLCASLLALCIPLMEDASTLPPPAHFAAYARERVSIADPPNLLTVQALIVLAMYEWGVGNGYRGWMYSGAATRMMQSLGVMVQLSSLAGAQLEIHGRTLWACYVMDRLVFCGRTQPFTLSIYSMNTRWPIAEDEFAFGQSPSTSHQTDEQQGPLDHMEGDMAHYYGILVRGFDIWARILKWVVGGGRRLPGMCLPENHPWVKGSPWRLLYDELKAWRERQEERLRYPQTSVEGHATLGQAEPFAYINLIYNVSLLFLDREYIQFLPTPECEPSGPVDPPLLSLQAPTGWWSDRADELFTSAAQIATILEELDDAGAPLYTPFAGFCGFSAATMNLYISLFPKMNHGRSQDTASVLSSNLAFLDQFRNIWAMGEGWWVTIQHCKTLYEHLASEDGGRMRGRTRADFTALEYSIHDVRGQPPTEEEVTPHRLESYPPNDMPTADHVTAAALSLQELSGTQDIRDLMAEDIAGDLDGSQIWPLWGEQHNLPFAIEGLPLDYNIRTWDGGNEQI